MLRWLIQDGDVKFCADRRIHPYFKNLTELINQGFEQPFWLGITQESFAAFLSHANLNLEELELPVAKSALREMSKTPLPNEMRQQIRRVLMDESLLESKFEIELLLHHPGDPNAPLPWDPLCEMSSKGVDGLFQGIKACWMSLLRPSVLQQLRVRGISLRDLQVSIVIRQQQLETKRGKAFSFSPRCAWDRRHMVVSYETGKEQSAFLVERSTLHASYYGKSGEEMEESAKALDKSKIAPKGNGTFTNHSSDNRNDNEICKAMGKNSEANPLPASDKIKKIADFLLDCEKKLGSALQMEWSLGADERLILRRLRKFDRTPSGALISSQYNSSARNFWDQSLLNWNPSALMKPFWFSLLPRNFRTLAIRYSGVIGVKQKLPLDYEKVFRGFWGILRGRPYINLGALHRFLAMGEHHDLAEELEMIIPIWMKRYDREMREAWDFQWPDLPSVSTSESKTILKKQALLLKAFPEKLSLWIDQMHSLREALVSNQWKEKHVSSLLEAFQSWERKYVPSLVPILLAEIQYWNLVSWYYQGSQKPSYDLSWDKQEGREPVAFEGNWLQKRTMEKMYDQMEMLGQMRPKYLAMLEDIYEKLRKFIELLGQKYQQLGQIEKADDIFYLTLEEMLALEEGRSATTSWKPLVDLRRGEYQSYARDQKVPEIWMTTGIVGIASRFSGVIAIKERKNPMNDHIKPAKIAKAELTPTRSLAHLDFIESESEEMSFVAKSSEPSNNDPSSFQAPIITATESKLDL